MSILTLAQESQIQQGFYVPQFQVKIQGVGLPRDVLRDVTQLTYIDNIKEIDRFEMTVNNFDPSKNTFKYVGSETKQSLQGGTPESLRYRIFEPCRKEVEIRMGYVGDLILMMRGNFTTMEPNFPASGPPTLTVRGLNVLHQLRRKQYTTSWPDKTDSQIAKDIANQRDRKTNKKRFDLPIKTDPNVKEERIAMVTQNNQYDIDFLLSRARQRGYVVYVREGTKGHELYFGPSESKNPLDPRQATLQLEWGKSLIDFKPTLTTANQVKSVTVKGWNRRKREAISETVELNKRELKLNCDLFELVTGCQDDREREEVVVEEPVFTVKQARQRARDLLMERQKEMVKASVTTIGLPTLRAGQKVRILGVGSRFSGTYFVTDTTHTISDSGYTTRFNARREEPCS
jgi:uncharacterized protein